MARQANDGGAGVATLLGNQTALNKAVNAGKKAAPAPTPWNTPQVGPSSAAALAAAAPKRATGSAPQASSVSPQTYMGMSTPGVGVLNTGAADTSSAAPAATPAVSQADYLAGDSTYQAALAALKKTMAGYQADHDSNEAKYDTDYNEGLTNLGWNGTGWNQADTNTAYGRSYQNQLNDFGSRDMLQSSYYGDALNQMARQFNQQKGDIDTARTNYRDDQDSTLNAENNQTQTAQQQALAEAIARMAAGVSAS